RQAVEYAERGILGGRGHLGEHRRPALIDRDEIGKRSADIDADAVHHPHPNPPPPAGEGKATARGRAFGRSLQAGFAAGGTVSSELWRELPPPLAGEGWGGGMLTARVRALP